jgi:hypothetical protein
MLTNQQLERLIPKLLTVAIVSLMLAMLSFAIACSLAIEGHLADGQSPTQTPCPQAEP